MANAVSKTKWDSCQLFILCTSFLFFAYFICSFFPLVISILLFFYNHLTQLKAKLNISFTVCRIVKLLHVSIPYSDHHEDCIKTLSKSLKVDIMLYYNSTRSHNVFYNILTYYALFTLYSLFYTKPDNDPGMGSKHVVT
jgi:hypothetical protein